MLLISLQSFIQYRDDVFLLNKITTIQMHIDTKSISVWLKKKKNQNINHPNVISKLHTNFLHKTQTLYNKMLGGIYYC